MAETVAEQKFLKVKKEHGVAVVTIDHPPVNALSPTVLEELTATLDSLANDKEAGVVVITGAGNHAFSAGADVKELQELGPDSAGKLIQLGQTTFNKIQDFPKPVIGAINNLTMGGGMELALACDMRISSDRARFGQPEVWLGLIPAWGGSTRLSRLVGPAKAKELVFTGQMVNAQEAYRIGLVNKIVPDGEEVRAAIDIGRQIVTKGAPLAIQEAKKAINASLDAASVAEGLKVEVKGAQRLAKSEDLVEGITAFVEKRQANFKGK
jgi:enoyl-CoA hydratase/carnithine racemase